MNIEFGTIIRIRLINIKSNNNIAGLIYYSISNFKNFFIFYNYRILVIY